MDGKEVADRFRKYEAEFSHYLKAKYFSDKDIYGGQIFKEMEPINGISIKASSQPPTRSYADPLGFYNDCIKNSEPTADNDTNISNGKHSSKQSA